MGVFYRFLKVQEAVQILCLCHYVGHMYNNNIQFTVLIETLLRKCT